MRRVVSLQISYFRHATQRSSQALLALQLARRNKEEEKHPGRRHRGAPQSAHISTFARISAAAGVIWSIMWNVNEKKDARTEDRGPNERTSRRAPLMDVRMNALPVSWSTAKLWKTSVSSAPCCLFITLLVGVFSCRRSLLSDTDIPSILSVEVAWRHHSCLQWNAH